MSDIAGDDNGRDIVDAILDDHREMRRRFGEILERDSPDYANLWPPLRGLLENHAHAEEQTFYPALVEQVKGGQDEARDGVHEHNEIREALGEVAEHEIGSERFVLALRQVAATNDHHMAEEEEEMLPKFRSATSDDARLRLGASFLQEKRIHRGGEGLSGQQVDPQSVISGASGDDGRRVSTAPSERLTPQ